MSTKNFVFKGKRKDNGLWIIGDFIESGDKCYIHPKSNDFKVNGNISEKIVLFEVWRNSVTEYARIKDMYGKKIFDGDIIKTMPNGIEVGITNGWLKTETGERQLGFYANIGCDFYPTSNYLENADVTKIIGNWFDNPDLWEEITEQIVDRGDYDNEQRTTD